MKMEQSSPKKSSSATADHSFALDGQPPNFMLKKLTELREKTMRQLSEVEATPVPTVKLYVKARRSHIQRLKSNLLDLNEAIAYEQKQATA